MAKAPEGHGQERQKHQLTSAELKLWLSSVAAMPSSAIGTLSAAPSEGPLEGLVEAVVAGRWEDALRQPIVVEALKPWATEAGSSPDEALLSAARAAGRAAIQEGGADPQQQQQQQGNLLSQAAAELAMEAVCLVSKLMNSRKEGTSGPEGAQAAVRWVDIMPAVRQAVGQCFGDPALVGPLLACLARCVEQHMQMATSPETAQGATGPMPVARGNLRGLCEAADALEPPTPCKGPPAASLCVPLREDERQELAWLAAFAAEAVPAAIPGSEHHKDCEAGRADGGALPAAVFQKLLNMTT
mmetsp:Transcript_27070/g.76336  ORF Transcript_27070/g.76336 Transcript_27070/m.76336 type:complete len:300 (-) Transcript_27070:301-1200(-)